MDSARKPPQWFLDKVRFESLRIKRDLPIAFKPAKKSKQCPVCSAAMALTPGGLVCWEC